MPLSDAFPRRWLLIRQGAIGDTILLSSVIRAIRARVPTAWIEVMGIQERVELLAGGGLADRAVCAERYPLECLHQEHDALPPALSEYLAGFDAVVYYTAARYPWLREKLRIHPGQIVLVHPALPPPAFPRHATHHYLEPLRDFLRMDCLPPPCLPLSQEEHESAKSYYLTLGIDPSHIFILGMHVGAGSAKKQAPLTFFKTTVRYFQNQHPLALMLTQGPADEFPVHQLLSRLPKDLHYHVLAGHPLRKLAALLSHADLFIGNDSGITHLAAAVGCPTVAVFTGSDPDLWRPLGNHVSILDLRKLNEDSARGDDLFSRLDGLSTRGIP